MSADNRLLLEKTVAALRAHDVAQRARIASLEELAAHQADFLEHLAHFFLEDDCKGVHDKIQAQLAKYVIVVKGGLL